MSHPHEHLVALRQSLDHHTDQFLSYACYQHFDELPERVKELIGLIEAIRGKVEVVIPDADQSDGALQFGEGMRKMIFETLEREREEFPSDLLYHLEMILAIHAQVEKCLQNIPKKKRAKRRNPAAPERTATAEEISFFETSLSTVFGQIEILPEDLSTVRTLSAEAKSKLRFEPFRIYADYYACTFEEACDAKSLREAAAAALAKLTNISARGARSFYAHAAQGFRSSK